MPDEPVWLYVSRLVAGLEDADADEADESDEGDDEDDDDVDELKYLRSAAIVDEFIYVTLFYFRYRFFISVVELFFCLFLFII